MRKLLWAAIMIMMIGNANAQLDSIGSFGRQVEIDGSGNFYLSIVPQFLIINGLRVDLERRFPGTQHAIVVSPRIFVGSISGESVWSSSSNFTEFDQSGFGVEVAHKIYIDKDYSRVANWYMSYSLFYHNQVMSYQGPGLESTTFNGVQAFTVVNNLDQELTINQYGGFFNLGSLFYVDRKIYIDAFIGIGIKRSQTRDSSYNDQEKDTFEDGFLNYGFSGTLPNLGMKIGILF